MDAQEVKPAGVYATPYLSTPNPIPGVLEPAVEWNTNCCLRTGDSHHGIRQSTVLTCQTCPRVAWQPTGAYTEHDVDLVSLVATCEDCNVTRPLTDSERAFFAEHYRLMVEILRRGVR